MTTPAGPTPTLRRIIRFPLVRILLGFVWVIAPMSLVLIALRAVLGKPRPESAVWVTPLLAALACAAYIGYVRVVERRPVRELAGAAALLEFGLGALLGGLLFTTTIAILWALGFYTVAGASPWAVLLPAAAAALGAGFVEELLVRGILFRILEESLGTWIALVISALLFGVLHLANPNATLFGAVAIALEAGVLLAAGFLFTRRLWLPIGIHFAWNFTEGGIFGVAVSGNQGRGLLQSSLVGPELISGGAFGAEASVIAVVVCSIAGAALLWRSHRLGRFQPPFWNRQPSAGSAIRSIVPPSPSLGELPAP